MASPSLANVQNTASALIQILQQFRKYAGLHTAAGSSINLGFSFLTNFDSVSNPAAAAIVTNFPAAIAAAATAFRQALAATRALAGVVIQPSMLDFGTVISAPVTDPVGIFRDFLYQYFVDNSRSVNAREFTRGSVSAVTGTGTGTINRLTTDGNNFPLEASHAEVKIAKCIADKLSGAVQHEEIFEFRGEDPEPDDLKIVGSGRVANIRCLSGRDSENYLSNPSFDSFSGTITTLTAVTDWTPTTAIGNFQLDQTNYYRGYDGVTTPASLRISTNDTMTQNMANIKKPTFDPLTPMYFQLAYNRQVGSGDGNLNIVLGSKTTTVALAAQTGWNILRLAIGQNNWFRRFNQTTMTVAVSIDSRTTGYTLVDDFILAPFTEFDGAFHAPVGGATPFLKDDSLTWTDTEVGAVIQYWLWQAFGEEWWAYLPANAAGAETWTDPTA